jgi:hypothetical protein
MILFLLTQLCEICQNTPDEAGTPQSAWKAVQIVMFQTRSLIMYCIVSAGQCMPDTDILVLYDALKV